LNNQPWHVRFSELGWFGEMQRLCLMVVGVGAVGHQVARMAASSGAGRLVLFDNDIVAPENVGPQMWRPQDVGERKVDVAGREASELSGGECGVVLFPRRAVSRDIGEVLVMARESEQRFALMLCVDSLDVRRRFWQWWKKQPEKRLQRVEAIYVDVRMGAEVCECYSVVGKPEREAAAVMDESLDGEAAPLPCTMKATAYCSGVAAGLGMAALTRALRGLPPVRGVALDLVGFSMRRVERWATEGNNERSG